MYGSHTNVFGQIVCSVGQNFQVILRFYSLKLWLLGLHLTVSSSTNAPFFTRSYFYSPESQVQRITDVRNVWRKVTGHMSVQARGNMYTESHAQRRWTNASSLRKKRRNWNCCMRSQYCFSFCNMASESARYLTVYCFLHLYVRKKFIFDKK